jgi:hypothetical protein
MATAQLTVPHEFIRGKIGDLIYRVVRGEQRVSPAPDCSRIRRTRKQKAGNRRFAKGVAYAGTVMADPEQAARYAIRARAARRRNGKRFTLREFIISEYVKSHPLDQK